MKVCIIYGSESGNSERAVKAIAKRWQGSNFEIGEIMELTESRVCQIHSNVMARLKAQLDRAQGDEA